MKKNYEKDQLLISIIFVFITFEILIFSVFLTKNFRSYKVISSIVISDNYLKSYVDSKMIKQLKSSKYLYIDNKRIKYEIIDIERKVIKKKKIWYHEILIRTVFPKKYKDNDTITLTIYQRRRKIYEIFKSCWKE